MKITTNDDLTKISCAITPLLNSLKSIYESSNFYKEARIISFIDHLYIELTEKIQRKISTNISKAQLDPDEYEDNIEEAVDILTKFKKGFTGLKSKVDWRSQIMLFYRTDAERDKE